MTKNFYKTETYNADHSTFGGLIYPSDFNTDYRAKVNTNGSTFAQRIVSDWKFDRQCRLNAENRSKSEDFKKGMDPYGKTTSIS